MPTGFLVDAMDGRGALDPTIKPIAGQVGFCGVALTCETGPSDNLAAMGALGVVQPGDVMIARRKASHGRRSPAISSSAC